MDLEPTNIHPRNTSEGATKCVSQPEHACASTTGTGHLRGLHARNVSRGAAGTAPVPKCSEAVLSGAAWKEHEDLAVQEKKRKRRRGEDLARKAVREERGKVGPTKEREIRRGVEREAVRAGETSARGGEVGDQRAERGGGQAARPRPRARGPSGEPHRGARGAASRAASQVTAQCAVTYQPGSPRAAE